MVKSGGQQARQHLFLKFAPFLHLKVFYRICVQHIQLLLIRLPHVVAHSPGKGHTDHQAVDTVNLRLKTCAFLFCLFSQQFLLGLPALFFSSRLAALDVLPAGFGVLLLFLLLGRFRLGGPGDFRFLADILNPFGPYLVGKMAHTVFIGPVMNLPALAKTAAYLPSGLTIKNHIKFKFST
jgi:hypothetical protein